MRFPIESILRTENLARVLPDCASKFKYICFGLSNFCILSDETTTVGVSKADGKTVLSEDISRERAPVRAYTADTGLVHAVAVDETSCRLFLSSYRNNKGQIVQFDLVTGQVLRNFDSITIGGIISIAQVGNLWLFGGNCSSKYTIINASSRKIVLNSVPTAIQCINLFTIFQKTDKFSKK